jgi:L-seryl-tRNA(Ser) seleniumtransferase
MSDLRRLPSVDSLLQTGTGAVMLERYGRELTVAAIRQVIESVRVELSNRTRPDIPTSEDLITQAADQIKAWLEPSLKPVINATGVILHTNLGRAPMSIDAQKALTEVAGDYSSLEYNLSTGERGARSVHAGNLITRLTGAEAAMVVNNNASALLLILTVFARRKGVVISRTQLVEIGGGFRIPEVMLLSGARLIEIGATNRVAL